MLAAQAPARSEVPEQPAKGAGHISAPRHPPCAAPPAPNPAAAAGALRPAKPRSELSLGWAAEGRRDGALRLRKSRHRGQHRPAAPQLVAAGEDARERRAVPEPSGSCPAVPVPLPVPHRPYLRGEGAPGRRGRWGLRQRGVSAGAERSHRRFGSAARSCSRPGR